MLSSEDQLAIVEVISRAGQAADAGDVEAYTALYTPDGHVSGGFLARQGESFRDDIANIFDGDAGRKRHIKTNHIIEGDRDAATVRSVLLIIEGGSSPTLVQTAQVRDELRKVDGRWLLAQHDVQFDGT